MEMSRASVGRWLAVGLGAPAAWAQPAPEPVVVTVLGTNYVARELGIENGADERRRALAVGVQIQRGIFDAYGMRAEFEVGEADRKSVV